MCHSVARAIARTGFSSESNKTKHRTHTADNVWHASVPKKYPNRVPTTHIDFSRLRRGLTRLGDGIAKIRHRHRQELGAPHRSRVQTRAAAAPRESAGGLHVAVKNTRGLGCKFHKSGRRPLGWASYGMSGPEGGPAGATKIRGEYLK